MKRAAGVLAVALLGLLVTARFAPTANADGTVRITSSIEAWYQANPTCDLATGCVTADAVPGGLAPVPLPTGAPLYPTGTLHVGFAGGKETARSYLLFPLDSVVGTVTSARLTVPLDTSEADGSVTPESSQVQVCLATEPVGRAEAALTNPPKTSCVRHVKLGYVATPAPHLQADLSSLLPDLLTADGLALIPDATSPAGAWHVVFHSHLADAKGAASLEVTTRGGATAPLLPVTEPVAPAVGLQPGPPVLDPGLSTPPQLGSVPQPPTLVTAAPAPVAITPVAQHGAPFLKYPALAAHPGAWLLPPGLLLLLGFLSHALRRDLSSTQS